MSTFLRLIRAPCTQFIRTLSGKTSFNSGTLIAVDSSTVRPKLTVCCQLLHQPLLIPVRHGTVFTSLPSTQLWEGVTGPPGGTKRRARGKRRVTRQKIDLNRGQRIGIGQANIKFPGLTTNLHRGAVDDKKWQESTAAYFQRLVELRTQSSKKKKRLKLPPLLRGWCGSKVNGQPVGPPVPELPDFDTRVIELKVVATMTATAGRYRSFSAVVATGNGKGLCGIGKGKSITMQSAIKQAKTQAAKHLVAFDLFDNRTLWHIGHVHEWRSKIFAKPLPEGSGLICHRLIRSLCQVIGIKDMYAKVEGNPRNYQALARGFLRLLQEQKTYPDLANETGLNVVELAGDYDMYPRVLAAPEPGNAVTDISKLVEETKKSKSSQKAKDEPLPILAISHPERHRPKRPLPDKHESFLDDLVNVGEDETVALDLRELIAAGERDLDALALGGRVAKIRGKPKPFYWANPGNVKAATLRLKFRNRDAVRREKMAYEALDRFYGL